MPDLDAPTLQAALEARLAKARAEAGARWPDLVRTAVPRAAAELWSLHVDAIDHLQNQAPVLYSFLPVPAQVSFAKEASARFKEYVWAVKAEALSALLTLPMPYERARPPATALRLSAAARSLLGDHGGDSPPSSPSRTIDRDAPDGMERRAHGRFPHPAAPLHGT
ncbi:MAG: hypothetical protein U0531_16025 [Dehalococcoidia bacterium]